MEKGHKQGYAIELFSDKPSPGRGFMLLVNVVIIGSILPLFFGVIDNGLSAPETITAAALAVPVIALVYWLALACARGTSYRIVEHTLELRCGYIYKKIKLHQILEISRTSSSRNLAYPLLRRQNFCNRLTDFVRLDLKGDTVFLSPSNPDLFIEQLRSVIPDLSDNKSPGTGESP